MNAKRNAVDQSNRDAVDQSNRASRWSGQGMCLFAISHVAVTDRLVLLYRRVGHQFLHHAVHPSTFAPSTDSALHGMEKKTDQPIMLHHNRSHAMPRLTDSTAVNHQADRCGAKAKTTASELGNERDCSKLQPVNHQETCKS